MAFEGYSERGQGSEERGPGTFTYSPGGVPQAQANGPTLVNMNNTKVADINSVSLVPGKTSHDQTLGIIGKFASEQLGKKVEEIRGVKFLEGMQRAATGEALTGIINDRPWYSKIFGDGPVAEGARAFEVESRVNRWVAEQDNDMASLRKQSPEAIPAYIAASIKKFQTGDANTDTMIAMQVMQQAPSLIKRHTRENFAYQQEEATTKQFGMWQAGAEGLQVVGAAAGQGFYTPNEIATREDSFLQSLQLTAGQNPDTWGTNLKGFVGNMASQGQFHALAVMEKNGIFKAMKPEEQVKLAGFISSQKAAHATAARETYAAKIDKIKFEAAYGRDGRPMSGQEVYDSYAALNSDYAQRSGNDHSLIALTQQSSTVMSAAQALLQLNRERESEAKAAGKLMDKEQAAQRDLDVIDQNITASDSKAAILAGGAEKLVNDNMYGRWKSAMVADPSGVKAAELVAKDSVGGHKVDQIASELGRMANMASDNITDNFRIAVSQFQAIKAAHPMLPGDKNPAVSMYYTSDQFRRLSRYESEIKSIPPGTDAKTRAAREEVAYQIAARTMGGEQRSFGKEAQGLFDESFKADFQGTQWFGDSNSKEYAGVKTKGLWFTRNDAPTPFTRRLVQSTAQAYYAQSDGSGLSEKERMADAMRRATVDTEVFGKYGWMQGEGRTKLADSLTFSPMAGSVPFAKEELTTGLDLLMGDRIKSVAGDKNPDDVMVIRVPDKGLDPQFHAVVVVDGQSKFIEFSGEEIALKASQVRSGKIQIKGNLEFGPKLSSLPDTRMPSPYASAEAWAKYRQQQADDKAKRNK